MQATEESASKPPRSGALGWWITCIAAISIVGVSFFLQNQYEIAPTIGSNSMRKGEAEKTLLPITRRIVRHKTESLVRFNGDRPMPEILEFLSTQSGKQVTEEAFNELTRLIVADVIPNVWQRSGRDAEVAPILHEHMHRWIQADFPHKTLANADVVFFPELDDLRIVVSEPNSDYFRDSAWHWKWIGQFADQLEKSEDQLQPHQIPLELDAYAAEELSEFLSVLAVAVIEVAARDSGADTIGVEEVNRVFERVRLAVPKTPAGEGEEGVFQRFLYSAETRKRVIEGLPNPMFRDVTDKTGITFEHRMSEANSLRRTEVNTIVGFGGGGVSIGDFDGDGDHDVYFAGDECGALFQNDGGQFSDVSDSIGLANYGGESRAGYFVDFDNDGDNDLFITRVGFSHLLLRNDGPGYFRDVSEELGFKTGDGVTHEAVWCDVDNDGNLDVYVANFGDWLKGENPTIGRVNVNGGTNELFMQRVDEDGNRSFEEVSSEMKVNDQGWSHCVGAYDFDRDGWTDLFSLNDFGASKLYRNLDGKGFMEVSTRMKIDNVYNAMNFTLMDLNHNGDLSVYISQIIKLIHHQRYKRPTEQTKVVFDPKKIQNMRIIFANCLITAASNYSRFKDQHSVVVEPADLGWSWGFTAYDYENDADEDVIIANGTEPKTSVHWKGAESYVAQFSDEENVCYAQEDGYLYNVSGINPIAFKGNSRCAMTMDFDADGDLDVFLANYDSSAQVFENLQQRDHNWIRLKLVGTRSNRNAIGARVELRFSGTRRFAQVVSRSGFLSQPAYELHFGLRDATEVEELIITWPSGIIQTLSGLAAGKRHEITESQE